MRQAGPAGPQARFEQARLPSSADIGLIDGLVLEGSSERNPVTYPQEGACRIFQSDSGIIVSDRDPGTLFLLPW